MSGAGTDEEDLVLLQPGGVPFLAPVRTTARPASARAAAGPFADAPEEDAVALCLSGGGWRALAFHAGAVAALGRTGRLARVTHVTGVSAGAVLAALLGRAWAESRARGETDGVPAVDDRVLRPARALAAATIDVPSVLRALLPPWRGAAAEVARRLLPWLGRARLADLPAAPRVEVHATSLEDGRLWVLDRDGARPRGEAPVLGPDLPLATAVAASAAFPPPLSPLVLRGARGRATLTDGGVHDNLGLETAWTACRTLWVSDGGGRLAPDPEPPRAWVPQAVRVALLVDAQVRRLRARQLEASFALPPGAPGHRRGAVWTLHDVPRAGCGVPAEEARRLARWPTRLRALPPSIRLGLERWGGGACLAALARAQSQASGRVSGPRSRTISTS